MSSVAAGPDDPVAVPASIHSISSGKCLAGPEEAFLTISLAGAVEEVAGVMQEDRNGAAISGMTWR